jgi:hypothetical protein
LKGGTADGAIHRRAVNSIHAYAAWSMIRKSGKRFFRKDHAQAKRDEIMIGFNLIEP